MTFVVAQDRWCTSPSGRAYVRGYDQQTVVGVGVSVQQAIREAGDFWRKPGYRLFVEESDDDVPVTVVLDGQGHRSWVRLTEDV